MKRAPGFGPRRCPADGGLLVGPRRVNHTSVTFKGYTLPFFFNICNLFLWKNTPRPMAGAQEALP